MALVGPDGSFRMIHDGQGAGEDDLFFEKEDLSLAFANTEPNGTWQLLVQDRLTGDPAVVTSFELEVVAE